MNNYDTERLRQRAAQVETETKAFIKKLRKHHKKVNLDERIHALHDEAFTRIDCLSCANCCKSISPILYDRDINRIAKKLRIKPSEFTQQYLRVDEDGDYVFRQTPCPLLMPDNYCSVYEARPRSCRDYPHTDRKNYHRVLRHTLKDTYVCPAVFYIIDKLKQQLKGSQGIG
ncbi:MAG TPA: YkgJ family cysteine cluster protein [Bacteroidales bacterium]|nr:YkgJ family cysteine cluster protein [Bacteroidales bacterium]